MVFITISVNAAVFTVTSKADSGTGTLREAITLANVNGTLTTDYIYFNLSGSVLLDVTIALDTELPVLTSNLVIDGTSQPFSALLNPNTKINLVRVAANYFNGFRQGLYKKSTFVDKPFDRSCRLLVVHVLLYPLLP